MFWDIFGRFGTCRDVLGHFETFWDIFGCFGTFWSVLGRFGTCWDVLGCFGTFWDVMGHFGLSKRFLTPRKNFFDPVTNQARSRLELYIFSAGWLK